MRECRTAFFHALALLLLLAAARSEDETSFNAPPSADGEICFNGCSGHGKCRDFVCECFVGFFGSDCRHTFAHDRENVVPVLGAGHFNLTSKSFSKAVKKHGVMLVGFSSNKCHKCIIHETEYARAADALKALGVPFARANADKLRSQLADAGTQELPALVVYKKGRPYPYIWLHSAEMIVSFVKKQLAPAVTKLESVDEVLNFVLEQPTDPAAAAGGESVVDGGREGGEAGGAGGGSGGAALAKTVSPLGVRPPGTTAVVGFFSEPDGMEEDEYEEFLEVVAPLQARHDVVVGVVTSKQVVARFKGSSLGSAPDKEFGRLGWIDRSPAVVVQRLGQRRHLNLDEAYYDGGGTGGGSLEQWIVRESLPLVDALTPRNFPLYEKLGLPMLLLFLELPPSFYDENKDSGRASAASKKKTIKKASKKSGSEKGAAKKGRGGSTGEDEGGRADERRSGGGFYDDDDTAETASGGAGAYAAADGQLLYVGGTSGGVANDDLLGEFLEAAKEHRGRIAFVYLDGKMHADQMRSLGLFGGAERLPALAWNTKDNRQMPFSEKLPINRDTLLQFCADFLSGRLQSKADVDALAKKALTNPAMNMKNLPTKRKPRKRAPEETRGISEQFRADDTFAGNHVLALNRSTFADVVLDERRDVVIMFHSRGCEPCANLAVYYKRVAQRFHELGHLDHRLVASRQKQPTTSQSTTTTTTTTSKLADDDIQDYEGDFEDDFKNDFEDDESSSSGGGGGSTNVEHLSIDEQIAVLERRKAALMAVGDGDGDGGGGDSAEKEKEKQVGTMVVARFDLTNESPPAELSMRFTTLPAIVLLPAKDKSQPYRYFSGVAKVPELMYWIQAEASLPFELPALAHLRDEDIPEYKRQVAEREQEREAKLRGDAAKEAREAEKVRERLKTRDALLKQRAKDKEEKEAAAAVAAAEGGERAAPAAEEEEITGNADEL